MAKKLKHIALDYLILSEGDLIQHKKLGYVAEIKRIYARHNALITVLDTLQNAQIWVGVQLPHTFKATAISKTFNKFNPQTKILC